MKIVFHSFAGRFSDSPRALHDALRQRDGGHEHVWLVDPAHAGTFPTDVPIVPWGSPEALEALESCDLLVANSHTEVRWTKRSGATYLQTWHGTPLKRIHWDVLQAEPGRLEWLHEDVERWDLLLSPNAASTPLLRQAFRFDGPVLETGYPRNDVLVGPAAAEVRARVRAQLGIADGTRAVLYTPTWRDEPITADGRREPRLGLDLDRLAADLGEDYVLLPRLHYFLTGALGPMDGPGVVDVSLHPEISELYLAADAMVTDYSSTMFDWAVTGKPLAFYVYDFDDYADRLRGVYFDLEPIAPGPVVRTQEELTAALADPEAMKAGRAAEYTAFQERYCHLEDGAASARVLDALAEHLGTRL